jgi:hypothetical protein
MRHNRMSLRSVVRLIVMQNLGLAKMLCEDGWWDLGCVELCCASVLLLVNAFQQQWQYGSSEWRV